VVWIRFYVNEPAVWVENKRKQRETKTEVNAFALGWLDYHLWEFVIDERKYGIPDPDRPHVKNGAMTQLATILASEITELAYVYDFGTATSTEVIPLLSSTPYFRKGDRLLLQGKKNTGFEGSLGAETREVFKDGTLEVKYNLKFFKP
jgi:Plasmid pRiA4b ORF-3-like protein